MPRVAVVTGSNGLIGSEMVLTLDSLGWECHGIDNNRRMEFFGPGADTTWNLRYLLAATKNFRNYEFDICDRPKVDELFRELKPTLVLHSAAQPSHDWAGTNPLTDFEVNALGTVNLLESTRLYAPEATFIFLSTNKVYGEVPNEAAFKEQGTRFDFQDPNFQGFNEHLRIDATLHSLFGASKAAADLMVQEYGRYFGLRTVCFRGGCLTGSRHSAAELHGFLAFLAKQVRTRRVYRIFGYKGKQVRDNLHAKDVCAAALAFFENPKSGAVYNLGGGRPNSVSIVEAIEHLESLTGQKAKTVYLDEPRRGDHICYITDNSAFQRDYPGWKVTVSLEDILLELTQKVDSELGTQFC